MEKHPEIHPKPFPELRLDQLELYGARWAERYQHIPIDKITLYRADTATQEELEKQFEGAAQSFEEPSYIHYVVVMEYTGDEVDPEENVDSEVIFLRDLDNYPTEVDDDFTRFIKETKFTGQYGEPHIFIDSAFARRVYKDKVKGNIKGEWKFFPKEASRDLPPVVLSNELRWILYPREQGRSEIRNINNDKPENGDVPLVTDNGIETFKNKIPEICFYKDGDFWVIGNVNEKNPPLEHYEGFRRIQYLLQNEGKELEAIHVYHSGAVPKEHIEEKKDYQPKLDGKSTNELIKASGAIKEKLSYVDDQEERDKLNHQLNLIEKRLKDKKHGFESSSKKARTAVFNSIKYALEKLYSKRPDLRKLLALSKTIKSGKNFSYRQDPANPVKWKLDKD